MDPWYRARIFESTYEILIRLLDPLNKYCSIEVISLIILITDDMVIDQTLSLMNENARGMLMNRLIKRGVFRPSISTSVPSRKYRGQINFEKCTIIPFVVLLSKTEACSEEELILGSKYILDIALYILDSHDTLREVGVVDLLTNFISHPHEEVRENTKAIIRLLST
jgi:hypothetical protein